MSIEFEQVDGVVQREGEGTDAPAPTAGASTASPRPIAEQFEHAHRRQEWSVKRLQAD